MSSRVVLSSIFILSILSASHAAPLSSSGARVTGITSYHDKVFGLLTVPLPDPCTTQWLLWETNGGRRPTETFVLLNEILAHYCDRHASYPELQDRDTNVLQKRSIPMGKEALLSRHDPGRHRLYNSHKHPVAEFDPGDHSSSGTIVDADSGSADSHSGDPHHTVDVDADQEDHEPGDDS